MQYSFSPPPEDMRPDLRRYIVEELLSIQLFTRQPSYDIIEFNVLNALPTKPRQGMVGYFAATVAGANEGIYRYDTGGSWQFVG